MTTTTQALSPEERQADQEAELAMRKRDDFRAKNARYFELVGRVNPETGQLYMANQPHLDRESWRLSSLAAQSNRHALMVEWGKRGQLSPTADHECVEVAPAP